MTTMNISLPDDLKAFIEAEISHGGYATPSDYLAALVREALRRNAKQKLDNLLREGVASGPSTPMTANDWKMLEARVWERHEQDQSKA